MTTCNNRINLYDYPMFNVTYPYRNLVPSSVYYIYNIITVYFIYIIYRRFHISLITFGGIRYILVLKSK